MTEWIRFFIVASLIVLALFSFISAVIGVYRFGFIMNRLHAAGIGDTLGLFLVVSAAVIASGFCFDSLKLVLLVFFMWFTSPVSTHFVGQIEYYSNRHLYRYVEKKEGEGEDGADAD